MYVGDDHILCKLEKSTTNSDQVHAELSDSKGVMSSTIQKPHSLLTVHFKVACSAQG